MRPVIKYIKKKLNDRKLIGAEVGVGKGDHAQQMVDNLNFEMLYLVDHWLEYTENGLLITTYAGKEQSVIERFAGKPVAVLKMDSLKAAQYFQDGYFDFVYIDANPSYQTTIDNIHAWMPKVKDGGVLGGNNAKWQETRQAVKDSLGKMEQYQDSIKIEGNEWFVEM